jgi:ubiquinone/menaquinone biosynthesis C-methylase UbiE
MLGKEWRLGSPDSLIYGFYDFLRNRLNAKLVNYLLSRAVSSEKAVVLEAGSGPGFASSMLNRDPRVDFSVALDIDFEALQQARKRDSTLPLVVADLRSIPFKTESVDVVWNSSTIEHLPDPEAALKEMTRVAKNDGSIFVGVPNAFGPLGFERWIRNTSAGVWIGKTFSLNGLKRMLEVVGLSPERHVFYFFRFFVGVLAKK